MNRKLSLLSLTAGALAISAIPAVASLYTFEDGLDSLELTQYVSGNTHSPVASGGLNNSAALTGSEKWAQVATPAGSTASFASLGIGESFTSSIFVKKSGGSFDFDNDAGGFAGYHSTSLIGLGIMDAADTHVAVDPTFDWNSLSVHVFIDDNNQYFLSVIHGEGPGIDDGDTTVSLSDGWYYFEATYTKQAVNQISVAASLSSADDTGAVGATLLSISSAAFETTLAGNSSVHSGFISSTRAGGDVVDNFLAIPEPSTYAMIAGALLLGVAVVRRRLRK